MIRMNTNGTVQVRAFSEAAHSPAVLGAVFALMLREASDSSHVPGGSTVLLVNWQGRVAALKVSWRTTNLHPCVPDGTHRA